MCHDYALCYSECWPCDSEVTANLCFLHRQSNLMASQDLHLPSSRKSHKNTNEMIRLYLTHALITHLCCVFTGEGTHSPQSGYVQPSPTTARHRSSDLSTFPHILDSHNPSSTFPGRAALACVYCPAASPGLDGTGQNLASTEKKKMPFESGIPLLLQTLIRKYFGTVLFTEQMLIYLRYIYFPCLFLSLCLWW